jgi:multidrug efflux pump subunit AcrB
MMPTVVRYTLKQSVFLNILFILLVVAGVFSLLTTPVENMPLVEMGQVFIQTVYYGASADDVEQLVTAKVEEALGSLENIEFIRSRSYRDVSLVIVKFMDDTDYRSLYDDVRFRVLNIKDELPAGVEEPTFWYLDTNMWIPVITVNVSGELPQRSLERYAEDLKTIFIGLPDVRDVDIWGDYDHEFHVSIDPRKLHRYGLTFTQVVNAIQSANTKVPTGRFRTGEEVVMLDAGQRMQHRNQVIETVVRRDGDGNYVRVADLITSARLHYRDPRNMISVNGRRSVRLVVTKEASGNSLTIVQAVMDAARRFEAQNGAAGIQLVFTHDSTIEIKDSVNALGGNLVLGLVLVTGVLWLTLGFRNAMLAAVGIPFSFLCALILVKISGQSINTISLFSFVLVSGIIVDDAVIIVENSFRHMQMGKSKRQAIVDGTAEVMIPVISSALTTVLAFLPMLIMTGFIGDFFAIIPKTVTFALIASLMEALFILPIHMLDWGPQAAMAENGRPAADPYAHLQSGIFGRLWTIYDRVVIWVLDHKILAFSALTVVFATASAILLLSMLGIVPLIEVKFFPGNYFRYHVTIENTAATAIEHTDAIVRDISAFIAHLGPGQAQSAAGDAGFFEDKDYIRHSGPNFGQIVVTLPKEKDRRFPDNPSNDPMRYLEHVRQQLNRYVAQRFLKDGANPQISVFEENVGPPTGKPVNIRVSAQTIQEAENAAEILRGDIFRAPQLDDLIEVHDDRPQLYQTVVFKPRQEAVYQYNLAAGQITAMVAGALSGMYVGAFRTPDEEVDLKVRIARQDDPVNPEGAGLAKPEDVLEIPMVEDSRAPVYLRDLVTAAYTLEPNVRTRYQGEPTITITADIRPGSKLSAAAVQHLVNRFFEQDTSRLTGVSLSYGGEFESTTKSYTSLGLAFCIALMCIYLVLASQFRDYFQPLIILTAVPFALIGVSFGLLVTRTIFTVGSFVATVGLSGVAVNNTLLLIDFMNKRVREGKELRTAVIEACAARMRPVLITTITTAIGLMPMAIGFPQKSITWSPMAIAFVTGLSSSTFLALLVTPANYEMLSRFQLWIIIRRLRALRRQRRRDRSGGVVEDEP